jgi:hypothetical protein
MQFAPAVYEHCARLIDRRPWEVSRDPDLLFEGQAEAYRRYRHAPVVVGVDIYNLEAEAYGARVDEPDGNGIPAIVDHPFAASADLLALPPLNPVRDGRLPMVLAVGERLRDAMPEADVRIPVAGPFSVASNLVGLNALLCDVLTDPGLVRAVLLHLVDGQVNVCRHIRERGLDIAFFESAAAPPLLSPAQFEDVELPALGQCLERAAAIVEHAVPCIIGGDTTPILGPILSTGTGYVICPAPNETDQTAFMAVMREHSDVVVRINMRPDITARGRWEDIRVEIDRIVHLAEDRPNTCLGTGALPYETDPETVQRIAEYAAAQ